VVGLVVPGRLRRHRHVVRDADHGQAAGRALHAPDLVRALHDAPHRLPRPCREPVADVHRPAGLPGRPRLRRAPEAAALGGSPSVVPGAAGSAAHRLLQRWRTVDLRRRDAAHRRLLRVVRVARPWPDAAGLPRSPGLRPPLCRAGAGIPPGADGALPQRRSCRDAGHRARAPGLALRRGRPPALAPDRLLPAPPLVAALRVGAALDDRRASDLLRDVARGARDRRTPATAAPLPLRVDPLFDARLRVRRADCEPISGLHRRLREVPRRPRLSRSAAPAPAADRLSLLPGDPRYRGQRGRRPADHRRRVPRLVRRARTRADAVVAAQRAGVRAALLGADLRVPVPPHRPYPYSGPVRIPPRT